MKMTSDFWRALVGRAALAVVVLAAAVASAQTPPTDPNDVFRAEVGKPL